MVKYAIQLSAKHMGPSQWIFTKWTHVSHHHSDQEMKPYQNIKAPSFPFQGPSPTSSTEVSVTIILTSSSSPSPVFFVVVVVVVVVFLFRATPTAYGSSWTSGQIRAATGAYATTMMTPDLICTHNLCYSLQQCPILNLLSEARDKSHILRDTMLGS